MLLLLLLCYRKARRACAIVSGRRVHSPYGVGTRSRPPRSTPRWRCDRFSPCAVAVRDYNDNNNNNNHNHNNIVTHSRRASRGPLLRPFAAASRRHVHRRRERSPPGPDRLRARRLRGGRQHSPTVPVQSEAAVHAGRGEVRPTRQPQPVRARFQDAGRRARAARRHQTDMPTGTYDPSESCPPELSINRVLSSLSGRTSIVWPSAVLLQFDNIVGRSTYPPVSDGPFTRIFS